MEKSGWSLSDQVSINLAFFFSNSFFSYVFFCFFTDNGNIFFVCFFGLWNFFSSVCSFALFSGIFFLTRFLNCFYFLAHFFLFKYTVETSLFKQLDYIRLEIKKRYKRTTKTTNRNYTFFRPFYFFLVHFFYERFFSPLYYSVGPFWI